MSFARVQVDLSALVTNYRLFKSCVEGEVGAVVKANGYGLGADEVVKRLFEAGCRSFFVATLDEALAITMPDSSDIYVFEPPLDQEGINATVDAGCIPVANDAVQLEFAQKEVQKKIAVHIDTGMERLGISYRSVNMEQLKSANVHLLMTHLACADDPDNPFNVEQVERFQRIACQFSGVRTSIGNSAATLMGERFQGDLARPGIGLYGANPFSKRENPTSIVATCEAQVLSIRDVESGTSVGYGRTYTSEKPTRIAVVGIGYADGVPRVLSNRGNFAFGDKLLPIRGHISMDVTQIDVTSCPDLKIGDWVEFFGKNIDCDDVAKSANSLGYEFLTGLGKRVERLYI
ncbi:MAG: alanine racemase [Gammaproteobacteria bacterium]|nr:alanine racemase [Gammaproteobacteria bacterium]